ncbi:MAG: hypothetical protein ACREJO_03440 [Phycisphaerales bacterium]
MSDPYANQAPVIIVRVKRPSHLVPIWLVWCVLALCTVLCLFFCWPGAVIFGALTALYFIAAAISTVLTWLGA